jgi:hypothetical protein
LGYFFGRQIDRVTKLYIVTVPLPCIVSDWTTWSTPDATGVRFRYRYMIRPALNGLFLAPFDLFLSRKQSNLGQICLINADRKFNKESKEKKTNKRERTSKGQ